jgi:hypothetical protein
MLSIDKEIRKYDAVLKTTPHKIDVCKTGIVHLDVLGTIHVTLKHLNNTNV